MGIRIGPFDEQFAKGQQVFLKSQVDFTVLELDDENKPVKVIGNSVDRAMDFKVKNDCMLRIVVPKLMHTGIEVFEPYDKVSDIPVEVDVEPKPLSMDQQIKAFCRELVQHEYGKDSEQMDTFDEMFDFDEEDDGQAPLGGYEVTDLAPEDLPPVDADADGTIDDNVDTDVSAAVEEEPIK